MVVAEIWGTMLVVVEEGDEAAEGYLFVDSVSNSVGSRGAEASIFLTKEVDRYYPIEGMKIMRYSHTWYAAEGKTEYILIPEAVVSPIGYKKVEMYDVPDRVIAWINNRYNFSVSHKGVEVLEGNVSYSGSGTLYKVAVRETDS